MVESLAPEYLPEILVAPSLMHTAGPPYPKKSRADSSLCCSNYANSFYSYLVVLPYRSNSNCLAAAYDAGLPALTK